MQINELKPKHKRKQSKTVGRGGKRGKTSGRGTKGQRARAGHKIRPEVRDLIKKLPKLRGRGKNSQKSIKPIRMAVNLERLEKLYKDGEVVNVVTLKSKGVLAGARSSLPIVILGTGEITKKLTIEGCDISETAKAKIISAGGMIKE